MLVVGMYSAVVVAQAAVKVVGGVRHAEKLDVVRVGLIVEHSAAKMESPVIELCAAKDETEELQTVGLGSAVGRNLEVDA